MRRSGRRSGRRARKRSGLFCLVSALAGLAGPVALADDERRAALPALAWLHPDADPVRALTTRAAECQTAPSADEKWLVDVGRAAFRSRFLLGGLAARSGLSCESCHSGGRRNADFFIAGFSGAPGTADVTSAWFSKSREDDIFNPRPIPDLAMLEPSVDLHHLEAFIGAAIETEFEGAPPTPDVMAGLLAYISRLDAGNCVDENRLAPSDDLESSLAAFRAAIEAPEDIEGETIDFLILSAMGSLDRLERRFVGAELAWERGALRALAAQLKAFRRDPAASDLRADIIAAYGDLAAGLGRAGEVSLYNEHRLRAYLDAPNKDP